MQLGPAGTCAPGCSPLARTSCTPLPAASLRRGLFAAEAAAAHFLPPNPLNSPASCASFLAFLAPPLSGATAPARLFFPPALPLQQQAGGRRVGQACCCS